MNAADRPATLMQNALLATSRPPQAVNLMAQAQPGKAPPLSVVMLLLQDNIGANTENCIIVAQDEHTGRVRVNGWVFYPHLDGCDDGHRWALILEQRCCTCGVRCDREVPDLYTLGYLTLHAPVCEAHRTYEEAP